ncbi:hypothetical protein D3C78_1584120 [compost metagenome]
MVTTDKLFVLFFELNGEPVITTSALSIIEGYREMVRLVCPDKSIISEWVL